MAHQRQELESCDRPVSKPFLQPSRRRGTCVCPASHCYRQRPTEVFIIAFFFFIWATSSTSNSCGVNDVELSKALTVYSVFSNIPFSWFNYCLRFTCKEAESPGSNNWQKVNQGERKSGFAPRLCFCTPNHHAPPCSNLRLAAGRGGHPSCWRGPLHSWLLARACFPGLSWLLLIQQVQPESLPSTQPYALGCGM